MKRNVIGMVAAAALLTGVAGRVPAAAAPAPNDATWREAYFPSGDGTQLHADVLLPKARGDAERHPVILSIGPYFGAGTQDANLVWNPVDSGPSARFQDLQTEGRIFAKKYAFVQVDLRGHGGSDGCFDLGGRGEQMDVKAAVEWAARQPWSTGKVGMWGKSYDAWTQVMALATKPKGLAAAVLQSPLLETYRGFFENGVHLDARWYATPGLYALYDLTPPTVSSSPQYWQNWATGTGRNPHCYGTSYAPTVNPDRTSSYWVERDIVKRAATSKVPVMWSHGFNDMNTMPPNIFDLYSRLTGPKRAWFGQWAHDRGNDTGRVGRDGFLDEAMAWFDHYLKGRPLPGMPRHEVQDGEGDWRSEASWPPSDGVMRPLPIKAGAYDDAPGNDAYWPAAGTWSVSQPAPHEVRIAGLPRMQVEAAPATPAGASLIAMLYDVAPDNSSRLVTRGAYRLVDGEPVTFDLWPTDWLLPRGHRLALQLSGADHLANSGAYTPTSTGTRVIVSGGALSLPLLTYARSSDLEGDRAEAQDYVPEPTMQASWFAGRSVQADFGRPMRRR